MNDAKFGQLAECIRVAVLELNIPHANSPVTKQVTISIGLASGYLSEEDEMAQLLQEADTALYKSKSNGRNRIEVFEEILA